MKDIDGLHQVAYEAIERAAGLSRDALASSISAPSRFRDEVNSAQELYEELREKVQLEAEELIRRVQDQFQFQM